MPMADPLQSPLRHHGDAEATDGLLDFAVNVYPGPPPPWLDRALRDSLDRIGRYPSSTYAEAAVAAAHGRPVDEVLATAGAAEAFTLVARLQPWRRPTVVHPQFTEPHAALEQAGHQVTEVRCDPDSDFAFDPGSIPDDTDLVVVGNPTNPTGVLHPADTIAGLVRPGRLVVVDEAFIDAVPGERQSLAASAAPGLVVLRSLTKHWGIPGIRAGYLLAAADLVAELRRTQTPWSVSTPAAAALAACATPEAAAEATRRAQTLTRWRRHLEDRLTDLGIRHVPSSASFVLAEVGPGLHAALRASGIAVRRADTFPGLGPEWVRIAVRPPDLTDRLAAAIGASIDESSRPHRSIRA